MLHGMVMCLQMINLTDENLLMILFSFGFTGSFRECKSFLDWKNLKKYQWSQEGLLIMDQCIAHAFSQVFEVKKYFETPSLCFCMGRIICWVTHMRLAISQFHLFYNLLSLLLSTTRVQRLPETWSAPFCLWCSSLCARGHSAGRHARAMNDLKQQVKVFKWVYLAAPFKDSVSAMLDRIPWAFSDALPFVLLFSGTVTFHVSLLFCEYHMFIL